MTVVENFKFGIPLVELPKYQFAEPVGTKPLERKDHIDYKLLDEMIDFIDKHPTTWRQGSWFQTVDTKTGAEKYVVKIETVEELNSCGSSFCLAGHVALRTGFPAPPLKNTQEWERKVDGQSWTESVAVFAAKQLGVTDSQAEALFAGENKLIDIKRMAILLKIDPTVSEYQLAEVRNDFGWDDDEDHFISVLKDYLP